jgi:hypothetical protein
MANQSERAVFLRQGGLGITRALARALAWGDQWDWRFPRRALSFFDLLVFEAPAV